MSNISVITSGTSGIGRAIVKKILAESAEGDRVIVNYGHSDQAAEDLKNELPEKQRERLTLVKADLSDYDTMMEFAGKVKEMTDHIDWLVLNTGIGTYVPYDEYTFELWNHIINTNLSIPAFLVRELKPHMAEYGNILFMGSQAGQQPYSSSLVYSVSKAGVLHMAKCLVKFFDDRRVSVNAIAPGFIETRWQKDRTDESYERINRKIAAHRFGTPEEVASLCFAVLSNDYLNGSVYEVTGGYDYF